MALIGAYGEFWSRQLIEWGARGRGGKGQLLGETGSKTAAVTVDVWDQEGVYVLHAEHAVVYVGLAHGTKLGPRLRGHRDDHLAGRWDQFSWYGTRGVLQDGTLGVSAKNKNIKTLDALRVIEALMIRASPEALNRSIEGLKGATLVRQFGPDMPRTSEALHHLTITSRDVQSRLQRVETMLARITLERGGG